MAETPSFESSQVFEDFFFENAEGPDCQLPCWHGLRVGVSGRSDIQAMFDTAFGFDGQIDIFENNPYAGQDLTYLGIPEVAGHYVTGWYWTYPEPPGGLFEIDIWLSETTDRLAGVRFIWFPAGGLFYVHTPQKIIRELGQPSYMFVSDPLLHSDSTGEALRLLIVYDQGLAFYFNMIVATVRTETGDSGTQRYGELCLESAMISDIGEDVIVEPLANRLEDLTPLQYALFGDRVEQMDLLPIERVFDTDVESITRLVESQEDACIRTR